MKQRFGVFGKGIERIKRLVWVFFDMYDVKFCGQYVSISYLSRNLSYLIILYSDIFYYIVLLAILLLNIVKVKDCELDCRYELTFNMVKIR